MNPLIVLIDSNVDKYYGQLLQSFQSTNTVIKFTNFLDFKGWYESSYPEINGFITNTYREVDGGNMAGENAIKYIVEKNKYIPILVFCGDPNKHHKLHTLANNLNISSHTKDLLNFINNPNKFVRHPKYSFGFNKFLGAIVGLAVGDAYGTTFEFTPRFKMPDELPNDIVGNGPFNLNPGAWTDDTSMMLCMLISLKEIGYYEPYDIMDKFCKWYKDGYMSSNGKCFDIGNATRDSLNAYLKDNSDPYCGSTNSYSSGNGSLMRLAPIPLFYRLDREFAITISGKSSSLTHGSKQCVDSCKAFAELLINTMNGLPKDQIIKNTSRNYHQEVNSILNGDFLVKKDDQISGSGYVIHSLEAALWAFYKTSSFEEGLKKVVSLGDDTDTTGAIYGQIAGAYYGFNSIPKRWVDKIVMFNGIALLSKLVYDKSFNPFD